MQDTSLAIKERLLERVFPRKQATVLAEVIHGSYNELVKTGDFNELKGIVRELAEAQKNTDVKMGEMLEAQRDTDNKMGKLTEAQERTDVKMGELAEAQKNTDIKMAEMAEAQARTDIKMGELAEDMKIFARELKDTRGDVEGLARSFGYALENEAYRMLPNLLKKDHGIELGIRLIRVEIGGKEINIFGKARRNGDEILVVGEAKSRIDERRKKKQKGDILEELEEKVMAVRKKYRKYEESQIQRVLVTHYATKGFLKRAKEKGVIVVQSFEW